jgi:hypothetical protein
VIQDLKRLTPYPGRIHFMPPFPNPLVIDTNEVKLTLEIKSKTTDAPLFKIVHAAASCGGTLAWVQVEEGIERMLGCICHYTLPKYARVLMSP